MKKFLILTLIAFLSINADHTVKKIVTFDTYNFKKTSVQCHIVGHGNFVTLVPDSENPGKNKQVKVKREYSIQTPSEVCNISSIVKGQLTCHLSEVTREVDTVKLSRLEGKGACRTSIAPDPELAKTDKLLQTFCSEFPDAKGCK